MAEEKKVAPVKDVQKKQSKTATCIYSGGVNIRKADNTCSDIVGVIEAGESVEVLETANGWHKIANGYVMAKYFN